MEPSKPSRRWFRFRLRTLLIMVTLLSVPLGWVGWELDQRRREKEVVTWVEKMGGEVYFPSSFPNDEIGWWRKTTDKCFGGRVRVVALDYTFVSDLSPLGEFKRLEFLVLNGEQFSNEQVIKLGLALPNCEMMGRRECLDRLFDLDDD